MFKRTTSFFLLLCLILLISTQIATTFAEGNGQLCEYDSDCPKGMICSYGGFVRFCKFPNNEKVTNVMNQQVVDNGQNKNGMKQIEKRVALKLISKILDQLIDQE